MSGALSRAREDELLLLLVQSRRSSSHEARIQTLLGETLDWHALLQQADVHGVTPIVIPKLQRHGYPGASPDMRAQLQQRMRANSMRNMLLAHELRSVLRQLAAAGVPAIPCKGVALAGALYGDYTLRECADLDLLVPKARLNQTVHSLLATGYQVVGPWQYWAASLSDIEITLLRWDASRRYDIDLHWGLMNGDPRDTGAVEALWAAARPATVLGVEAWAMSPEWEFLSLVLHAARHQWQSLKWLVDLQVICWTWELNWPAVWCIAERWGWVEILRLTIGVCHTLWDLPALPHAPAVPCPAWLPRFPASPHSQHWPRLRTGLLLFPNWRLRLGYILRLMLLPTAVDYAWLPLPVRLFPLYVVLRPLRFGHLLGKQAVNSMRRRFLPA